MAITFIILMEILLIMIYQTLPVLAKKSICLFTQKRVNGLEAKKTNNSTYKHKKKQKYGTQAKKVINGIVNTAKRVGKTVFGIKQFVLAAVKSTQHPIQLVLSFVRKNARLNTTIGRKSRLLSIPVFNLTVDKDHCYYANGILVSNSDAFRILPYIYQKAKKKVDYKARLWNGNGW